jgi:sn-glycerol 3-phosphate transport system ATP-binding protein
MGRAIVREPAVFLFDEPLSNLDAALRGQMRVEIRELQRRLDTTGVFVTHDQIEAMTLADRILLMNEGRVEQVGAPMELYRRPETTYVAAFIGAPTMNLVEGRLDATGARFERGAVVVDLPVARPALAGRPVTLGVRPEDLHPAGDDAAFRVPVRLVERLGADQVVFTELDGHGSFVVRLPGTVSVREGDTLAVAATARALHLFDPATGRRFGALDAARVAA